MRYLRFLLVSFFLLNGVIVHSQERRWERIGSLPPRISGIASVRDTVLISTENGAFVRSTSSTEWVFAPTIPDGRLVQSTSGAVVAIGIRVRLRDETSAEWRISTLPEHRPQVLILPKTVPHVTRASVRMPDGYEIHVTRGGITLSTGGIMRLIPSQLDETQGIIGMVRIGTKAYCALERSIICIEEVNVPKYNPLEPIPFRRFRVVLCVEGLSSSIDALTAQSESILANKTWFSADSGQTWQRLVKDSVLAVSYIRSPLPTLLQRHKSGISYSRDNGARWFQTALQLPPRMKWYADIRSGQILPHVSSGNVLVFFLRDSTLGTLAPTHLLESRDGGLQWLLQPIQGLPGSAAIGNIQERPRGVLVASDNAFPRREIFRSTDGGKTWQPLVIGRVPELLSIHPTSGTILASGAPPMRSVNNGESWNASDGLPFRTSGRFEGASTFRYGFLGAVLLNVRGVGAFLSRNDGVIFTPLPLPVRDVYLLAGSAAGHLVALAADTARGRARTQIWFSENNGTSWERLESGLPQHDMVQIHDIIADGATLWALTNRGVWRLNLQTRLQASLPSGFSISKSLQPQPDLPSLQSQQTSVKGLGEMPTGELVKVFPNPAQETLFLSVHEELGTKIVGMEIFNVLGARVDGGGEKTLTSNAKHRTISISHLPNGQYFCRVHSRTRSGNDQFFSIPFLVQR